MTRTRGLGRARWRYYLVSGGQVCGIRTQHTAQDYLILPVSVVQQDTANASSHWIWDKSGQLLPRYID